MTLLFSSFLFIISKFYISTIIVKIQLNDNKLKNINLLFTTQYKLLCHVTFMIVIRSLWNRVFAKENGSHIVIADGGLSPELDLIFMVY
jgi:hypothetical protein